MSEAGPPRAAGYVYATMAEDGRPGLSAADQRARIAELVAAHEAERVVVGLPLTMMGHHGEQAVETEKFVRRLRETLGVPVESFDERFTTDLAEQGGPSAHATDAVAAAHLLSSYLTWSSRASR